LAAFHSPAFFRHLLMTPRLVSVATLALATMTSVHAAVPARIYVGTYTGPGADESRGIYVVDFDPDNGTLGSPRLAAEATNPSFLALTGDGRRLYSVSEVRQGDDRSGAALVAWRVRADGTLEEIGRAPSGGDGPCFVGLSPDDRLAGVANYGGGSVALFRLADDGRPTRTALVQHEGSSVNPQRQQAPHAHSFQFAEDGSLAFAADLGTDELVAYDVGEEGTLRRNETLTYKLPAGHGPRHFTIAPDGRHILVIEELSSIITVLRRVDDHLEMHAEYATLPDGFAGSNTTAEIQLHPHGRFVYGSNRGHDSLAVFAFDAPSGRLTPRGHVPTGGQTPRNFRLSRDGKWLIAANQTSNSLVVFRIGADGLPTPTGQTVSIAKPVCVKFSYPQQD
jgi:6-phosphogluconolactonase